MSQSAAVVIGWAQLAATMWLLATSSSARPAHHSALNPRPHIQSPVRRRPLPALPALPGSPTHPPPARPACPLRPRPTRRPSSSRKLPARRCAQRSAEHNALCSPGSGYQACCARCWVHCPQTAIPRCHQAQRAVLLLPSAAAAIGHLERGQTQLSRQAGDAQQRARAAAGRARRPGCSSQADSRQGSRQGEGRTRSRAGSCA